MTSFTFRLNQGLIQNRSLTVLDSIKEGASTHNREMPCYMLLLVQDFWFYF